MHVPQTLTTLVSLTASSLPSQPSTLTPSTDPAAANTTASAGGCMALEAEASTYTNAKNTTYSIQCSYDFTGVNIGTASGYFIDCFTACDEFAGCTAFSFLGGNGQGTCYLKNETANGVSGSNADSAQLISSLTASGVTKEPAVAEPTFVQSPVHEPIVHEATAGDARQLVVPQVTSDPGASPVRIAISWSAGPTDLQLSGSLTERQSYPPLPWDGFKPGSWKRSHGSYIATEDIDMPGGRKIESESENAKQDSLTATSRDYVRLEQHEPERREWVEPDTEHHNITGANGGWVGPDWPRGDPLDGCCASYFHQREDCPWASKWCYRY